MPEGVDATSFEFYEGIRILVPGLIGVGVGDAVVQTITASSTGLGLGALQSVVAALLLGLAYYFVDAPAKAAVIVPLRPTGHIHSWGSRTRPGTTLLNVYFVILDVSMPSGIKARALYMGSIYRIGFEIIYMLVVAVALVFTWGTWTLSSTHTATLADDTLMWLEPAAFTAAWVAMWLVALKRDRASGKRFDPDKTPNDVNPVLMDRTDVVVGALTLLATSTAAGASLLGRGETACALVAAAVVTLGAVWWSMRYFRGYPSAATGKDDRRRPISAAHATLVLGLVLTSATALARLPTGRGVLSPREFAAWCVVGAALMALVASRGHEKRLKGAYATQNTWLTLNKGAVSDLYLQAEDASVHSVAAPGGAKSAEEATLSTPAPLADTAPQEPNPSD